MSPKPRREVRVATPPQPSWIPRLQHALPAAVLLVYTVLFYVSHATYKRIANEDSWIEWLTVAAFLTASLAFAILAARRGWRDGWFAAGLALFCFIIAGEEISWGGRILSLIPPEIFLQNNFQEETNVHNLVNAYMSPKWMNVTILFLWTILLPFLHDLLPRMNVSSARTLLDKLRFFCPPLALMPWALVGIWLQWSYPMEFTSEGVELMTGLIFFAAALPFVPRTRAVFAVLVAPLVLTAIVAFYQDAQGAANNPAKTACAQAEVRAIAAAVEAGGATAKLFERSSVDQRLHYTIERGYIKPDIIQALDSVACAGVASVPRRHKYTVDPWGVAYWIYYSPEDSTEPVPATVYSFGPNRKYDSRLGRLEGTDDIGASTKPLVPKP